MRLTPEALAALAPVFAALAVLLTAGVGALIHLAARRPVPDLPWRPLLAARALASPWRGRDLIPLLLPVAAAIAGRRFLPNTAAWDLLAVQGVLTLAILWRARGKVRPFGIAAGRAGPGETVLRWLAILPVLWFAAFAWQLSLHAAGHEPALQPAVELFLATRDPLIRALFFGFAVVLAPFTEEVVFRGLLLPLLVRRGGPAAGLLATAVFFGAVHGDLGTFPALAVFSVALSLAYARTGTLWVPMGMHALFNAASMSLMLVLHRAGVV